MPGIDGVTGTLNYIKRTPLARYLSTPKTATPIGIVAKLVAVPVVNSVGIIGPPVLTERLPTDLRTERLGW
jgi:hypothetical protein